MEERAYSSAGTEATAERLKVPPQSIEAEQSVLGGLMLDNRCLDQIGDKVTEQDFYRREHRLIYRAICSLCEENNPADVVTVSEQLQHQGELENAGGLAYLGALAKNTPSTANVHAYADIVRERSIMRQLLNVASDITGSIYEPEGRNTIELLDHAERSILAISDEGSHRRGGFQPLTKLLSSAVDRIDKLYHSDSPLSGIPTGFSDLDEITSGLQNADLIIVAGRPSMGKTSLAMNIAESVAVGQKLPVAIFSMEMAGEQLAMRMLASMSRINTHRIRTGKLNDEDWPRVTSTMSLLSQAPVFVDDTPDLTPMELRARARRLKREHGLGLILVDYLQMMQAYEGHENRATEISHITRALKNLAKELNIPLIAMSQLNRSLEQRPNKRPVMSDLRESGSIEQDADVILFIYRDEVYNEDSVDKGTAEIIIGKQRNGPIGTVRLTFLGQYTKFENYISADFDEAFG
jgi:replicative DNA helicase